MVTGDHPITAHSIAKSLGLVTGPTEIELNELRKREYLSALSNLDEYLKKKRTFLSTS